MTTITSSSYVPRSPVVVRAESIANLLERMSAESLAAMETAADAYDRTKVVRAQFPKVSMSLAMGVVLEWQHLTSS